MPSLPHRVRPWPRRIAAFCCAALLAPAAAAARQDAPERARHHAPAAHPAVRHEAAGHGGAEHGAAHRPAHVVVHGAGHAPARVRAPVPGHAPGHVPGHGEAHSAAGHPPRHAAPRAAAPVVVPVPSPAPVAPPPPPAPQKGTSTGLPLPRFAALRADTVNLRSGPGTRYPIQWVYKRRDLPVEVEREFDVWRLVEFSDGTKGWVNQATLIGTRTFLVEGPAASEPVSEPAAGGGTGAGVADGGAAEGGVAGGGAAGTVPAGTLVLRGRPDADGPVVALVRPGVVGRLRACAAGSGWCRVSIRDYTGWLPRRALWGLMSDETISPP